MLALELARRGIRVVVLESGPRHDFARRGEAVRRYLRRENPWPTSPRELDRYTVGGPVTYQLEGRRARGVGGSTLHWEGYALRLHARDFRLRYALRDRGRLADLVPGPGALLRRGRAHARRGRRRRRARGPRRAARPSRCPPSPSATPTVCLRRPAATLGHRASITCPRRATRWPTAGVRSAGPAGPAHVCPTGAKASIDLTQIPQAEATGNARVVPEATVLRLEVDAPGRSSAAVYAGPDKVERRLTARVFVLAAGAVENGAAPAPVRLARLSRRPGQPERAGGQVLHVAPGHRRDRARPRERLSRIASGSRRPCRGSSPSSATGRPAAPSSSSS